ncbi:hypothetical protein [Nocardia brasiliensis]|uniref:hypothetical protein n=1 Tax=Nocardia brasiliensis TaxID=37326 RepID=UPI0004A743AC|nr:hypothetical protein [Nocardia brasiliensis]MBF6544652.1 hypothetical protein [Nocardia brasiliensis]
MAEPVPAAEFPHRMGKVANRELAAHGYTRYDQLTAVTAKELLRIHGVGPKAIRILEEELSLRGLRFADQGAPLPE